MTNNPITEKEFYRPLTLFLNPKLKSLDRIIVKKEELLKAKSDASFIKDILGLF